MLFRQQSIADNLRQHNYEENFERQVRANATDLARLAEVVHEQEARRCLYLSNEAATEVNWRSFRGTQEKFRRLLSSISAQVDQLGQDQVAEVARLVMASDRALDVTASSLRRRSHERVPNAEDSVRDVFKRVSNGDFSGFRESPQQELEELRLAIDEQYPNSNRNQLAIALNKLLDFFQTATTPLSSMMPPFFPPWMMWFEANGPKQPLERMLRNYSHARLEPRADRLAKALLANDEQAVKQINLTQAIEHARHRLDGDDLAKQLVAVKAAMNEVRKVLIKLKESPNTWGLDDRLAFIIGSLALHRVGKLIESAKLPPNGPRMILSGTYEAKLLDPCRLVITLVAEKEQKRGN